MEQRKKIRLSDIAEKLGVSTVTVSKALADKEGVGDDLRRQIQSLAAQMGYTIKKEKTKLSNATGNIGILIPNKFFAMNHSYYWYLFNFLSKELLNRNYYSIMELLTDEDEAALNIPRMIQDEKIDGLIILGQISDKYLDAIDSKYNNFILLDFYTNRMNTDSVCTDDFFSSYLLTSYVISQGHKNLRFVGNFEATTAIRDRFMGFQKALYENGIETSVNQIIPDRDEKGLSIKIPLPQKKDMPTAFICNNDETAAIIMNDLISLGYKIPDDISVTGFDNFVSRNQPPVELTTVYIKPEDTARMAADLIISKITGTPYIKGRHLVSGSLIIRNSVKKL